MRANWRAGIGLVISAGLLWFALRTVNWHDVRTGLAASNLLLWLAATVVSQLTFPLRALRWRSILHPVSPNLPYGPLWRSTAIGMMVNNTALARAGEVVRAYTLNREEKSVPFTTALASLVVDRTFDSLVVLGLLLIAVADPAFRQTANVEAATINTTIATISVLVFIAFGVLYAAVFAPLLIERVVASVVTRAAPRWSERIIGIVRSMTQGLGALRNPRLFATVLVLTIAGWVINACSFWIGFAALGIHLPFTAVLLVQGLIVIAVAAPQAPGFFGGFEAAAIVGLSFYGVGSSVAVTWALGYHILSFIPITLIGLYYATKLGVSASDAKKTAQQ